MKSLQAALVLVGCAAASTRPATGDEPAPAAELVRQLKSPAAGKRAEAAWALARRGEGDKDVVAALRAALGDESRAVRARAAVALWVADPDDRRTKELLPGLLAARNDPDDAVRALADEAWAETGAGVRAALPLVRRMLAATDIPSQQKAVEALAKPGLDAVPALLDAVAEERSPAPSVTVAGRVVSSGRFQAVAATALAQTGGDTVPTLREALRDRSAAVRETAALALGRIGPAARSAAPDLIEMFADRDPAARFRAADAVV